MSFFQPLTSIITSEASLCLDTGRWLNCTLFFQEVVCELCETGGKLLLHCIICLAQWVQYVCLSFDFSVCAASRLTACSARGIHWRICQQKEGQQCAGERGNWEQVKELLQLLSLLWYDKLWSPETFPSTADPSRMCHTFMRGFVRKYKCHTKRSTVTLIYSIIYVVIYLGDCKASIKCFDSRKIIY